MNIRIQSLVSILASGLLAFSAAAIPAKRGVMAVEQPDGTTVNVTIVGDERAHQYFTPDGYLLAQSEGYFYYATGEPVGNLAVSSGIRASDVRTPEATALLATIDREAVRTRLQQNLEAAAVNPAAPGRYRATAGLFPQANFPVFGEQRSLVILVEYKDVEMTMDNAHDYFHRMLNEYGFSDYGGTGCGKEYFDFNSSGQFLCDFDVYGPVKLANNRSYYGANDSYGDDKRPANMVAEACAALDDEIDFSLYDRDRDGYVDNVFVFYAGRGEASGGPAESIWPHSWALSYGGISQAARTFDGVVVESYACSNEYEGSRPDGVGTFIHEFSHVIGLPDLYATNYSTSFTPDTWSALDYGPYNNDGCTPPNYSAFERSALGWLEPVRITGPLNATLPPISENVAGIVYSDSNPDEYFLFENRQKTGWDAYIPGHGMLVWHIDYDSQVWYNNTVNNNSSHQYVDIEEADNKRSDSTRAGDAFPGTSKVTTFTDSTSPSMCNWAGQGFGLPLTEIAETDGIITFKVAGGADEMAAPELSVSEQTFETLTITWEPLEGAALFATIAPAAGAPSELTNCGASGSYTFDSLEAETEYTVVAYLSRGLQRSESSSVTGFTGQPTLEYLAVAALEAEEVGEDCFTARWEMLDDANDYYIYVYERVYGAPLYDECGFDDLVSQGTLPEGWTTTTTASYSSTAYSGAAVPALRISKSSEYVETPVYAEDVRCVSFWHRGNNVGSDDKIRVYLHETESDSWSLYAELDIVTEQGGATSEVNDIPAGHDAVRIGYFRNGAMGALAVDDVKVGYGATYTSEVLEQYNGVATGNADSFLVEGLTPDTNYAYEIEATDGERVSRRSNTVRVTTKESSALVAAEGSRFAVEARGKVVAVAGAPANSVLAVSDLSGRIVAAVRTDASGSAAAIVPSSGFYLVQAGRIVAKIAVK